MHRTNQLNDLRKKMADADIQIFTKLCKAARALDEVAIYKLFVEHGANINFKTNLFISDSATVVMVMAEEQNHAAVDFLITKFQADVQYAVEGYARAGCMDKVEAYLLEWDVRDVAVRGCAYTDRTNAVNNLLQRGASIGRAGYGYGRAGNNAALKVLFDREDLKDEAVLMAVEGSAHSNFGEKTEALILSGAMVLQQRAEVRHDAERALGVATKNPLLKLMERRFDHVKYLCHVAIGGYTATGILNDEARLLRLFAETKDDNIFKHYINFVQENKTLFKTSPLTMTINELVKTATERRLAMKQNHLSYDEVLTSGVVHAAPAARQRLFSLHARNEIPAPAVSVNEVVAKPVVEEMEEVKVKLEVEEGVRSPSP